MLVCRTRQTSTETGRKPIPSSASRKSDPRGSARGRIGKSGRHSKCHTRPAPTPAAWTERENLPAGPEADARPNGEAHLRAAHPSQVAGARPNSSLHAARAAVRYWGRTPRVPAQVSFAIRRRSPRTCDVVDCGSGQSQLLLWGVGHQPGSVRGREVPGRLLWAV